MFLLLLGCMPESQWLADPGLIELTELQARPLPGVVGARFTPDGDDLDLSGFSFVTHGVVEHDGEQARLAVDIQGLRLLLWFDLQDLTPGAWAPFTLEGPEHAVHHPGGAPTFDGSGLSELWYVDAQEPLLFTHAFPREEPLLTAPDGELLTFLNPRLLCGCSVSCRPSEDTLANPIGPSRDGYRPVETEDPVTGLRFEGWVRAEALERRSRPTTTHARNKVFQPGAHLQGWSPLQALLAGNPAIQPGEPLYDAEGELAAVALSELYVDWGEPEGDGWIPLHFGGSELTLYLPPE